MYYTRQSAINDPEIPVSSNDEINQIIFNYIQEIPNDAIWNDWIIVGANEIENRPEDLFFPSQSDYVEWLNG